MKTLGNIIWFIFGGFITAIVYFIIGIILCITVIGIPFGTQCFKLAELYMFPFKKEVKPNFAKHPIANLIWMLLCGWEMFVGNMITGIIYCCTIIGIPFGIQWFKLALLSLMPFGSDLDTND